MTLCAKCLAAEVALEWFLSSMCSKVHVEIGFLGKSMIAELTHKRTLISGKKHNRYSSARIQPVNTNMQNGLHRCFFLVQLSFIYIIYMFQLFVVHLMCLPVNGFDVHLQAVATGSPMAALLTHKQFLTTMFGCLV